jgi:hypothetical protein
MITSAGLQAKGQAYPLCGYGFASSSFLFPHISSVKLSTSKMSWSSLLRIVGVRFHFAKMINTEVVPDTHGPGQKFTFIGIAATSYSINNPDKNILKNIFGKILVFNQKENGGIQFVLMDAIQALLTRLHFRK